MSRAIRRIASIALPIVGNIVAPGIGGIIGGAAGGALGGGGLRGALLGGATSALAGGLGSAIGSPGTAINWTSAAPGYSTGAQVVGGSGLLGGLSRAVAPSGIGQSIVQGAGRVAGALMPSGSGAGAGSAVGSSLGGGTIGNLASNVFSGIQGTQAYRDMQSQQLGANRQALAAISPFAATGTAANTQLSNLLGLSGDTNNEEILNTLRNTPGYQFQLQQGQQAIDRAQAARGGFFSGEALKASQQFGQGIADQTYNEYLANLQNQQAQGLNAAGGMANLYQTAGDIRANTTLGRANLLSQTLANILNPQQGV